MIHTIENPGEFVIQTVGTSVAIGGGGPLWGRNGRLEGGQGVDMKKVALILVAASLVLTACGGADFTGSMATSEDAAVDALAETSPEAGKDGQGNPDSDAGTDAADEADAAAEADAIVPPDASPDMLVVEAGEPIPEAGPEACVPGTCQSLGKNCGSVSDGCGGTIASCGTCAANESCGGGGVPHVCGGCVADTCANHGYNCGSIPDGCGNALVCGPAFVNMGPDNYACKVLSEADAGVPAQTWRCLPFPSKGPKPFADCVPDTSVPSGSGYCCNELP